MHFAIDRSDRARLQAAAEAGDEAVWELIHVEIEENCEKPWTFETDKAWDAIHRCLTSDYKDDSPPLNLVVMGGYQQIEGESGVVSVAVDEDLPAIADALEQITEEWMRERYFAIDPEDYDGPLNEEDFAYTWSSFQGLPEFYRHAAKAGDRDVVFTVDW